jgi:2-keto-4-pentenoate hydratase/2-oxohepta-3-ene-1,7-dioic acid hydratase in catechol pathway
MRYIRFRDRDGNEGWGFVQNEAGIKKIKGLKGGILGESTGEEHLLEEVKILPPVIPNKIVACGLNYKDHAEELNMPIPDEPVIFIKPSTSIIGHKEPIIYPRQSKRVDYEAELAVVIKERIKDVAEEEAMNYVLGYTCFNDVTARDLQRKDGQWTRAKSFDTFSPIGPFLVDDLMPDDLEITLYLNGQLKQSSRTSNLIFKIPRLISFISQVMTLLPGDVVATGTPSGVGPMRPGDIVEVKIEGIGSLMNFVKTE